MKESVRIYHIFLPRPWLKWCIYIFFPLLTIGGIYVLNHYAMYYQFICMGFACCIIVAAEFMMDTYMFLGIAARNTNRLEYLKTSAKGLLLLKKALITDAVRRFLTAIIVLAGVYCIMPINYNIFTLKQCLLCITAIYLLMELGFMLTRFYTNVLVNLTMAYVLGGIACVTGCYVLSWNVQIWMLLLSVAADVGVAVAGRKLILKRAKESFYDT